MEKSASTSKNIILVHGAFADGAGWKNVYVILKKRGYKVSVVGNPNTGLDDDVEATKRVLDRQDGPALLVGHSYGGAIITAAGNSPKVAGLVYIAAFAPDKGESLGDLLGSFPRDPLSGIGEPVDGYVWYDNAKYHTGFAGDLSKEDAEFLADSQVPAALTCFTTPFTEVAWKTKPTWYVVATEDHSIPPDLERKMGKRTGGKVFEIKGCHLVFISFPEKVADVIEMAAKEVLGK